MKNYFIIHGTRSNQYGNWIPWLYEKLAKSGEKCLVPNFPADEGMNYRKWKKILEGYLAAGEINEDTIFICHSLGCVFVTRFVVEHRLRISGIVAVAGFNDDVIPEEYVALNKSFLTKDKTIAKISNYVKFFHCIFSDNDPYVQYDNLLNFAKLANAKVHEIEGGGHLNGEAGYNEFPFLWELLDKINTIV